MTCEHIGSHQVDGLCAECWKERCDDARKVCVTLDVERRDEASVREHYRLLFVKSEFTIARMHSVMLSVIRGRMSSDRSDLAALFRLREEAHKVLDEIKEPQ